MSSQGTILTREPAYSIWVSTHKKVDARGCEFSYGWLSGKISTGVVFSFETKTGKVNLTGYPWESFQEDLDTAPYSSQVKEFFLSNEKLLAKELTSGKTHFYIY